MPGNHSFNLRIPRQESYIRTIGTVLDDRPFTKPSNGEQCPGTVDRPNGADWVGLGSKSPWTRRPFALGDGDSDSDGENPFCIETMGMNVDQTNLYSCYVNI